MIVRNGRLADLKRMSENFQRVLTERDDALELVEHIRGQRDAHVCAAPVNVYPSTPPHDHVVISLAGYNTLVTERDEALAKFAACVDVVSFVDGRWLRALRRIVDRAVSDELHSPATADILRIALRALKTLEKSP